MRTYIFTESERKILKTWIKKGVRLANIDVLIHRIKGAQKQVQEDYRLFVEALRMLE